MKAATGELNLTLITVVAIGAILAIFSALLPQIKEKIIGGWNNIEEGTDNIDNMGYNYDFLDYIETELF